MGRNYEEYIAKNMLLKYFGKKLGNIKKLERPDLQSEKYGIEVTMLVNENDMENRKKDKNISKMFKMDPFLYNLDVNNKNYESTEKLIRKAIRKKVKRKKDYDFNGIYCLFLINCNNTFYEYNKKDFLNKFISYFDKLDKDKEYSFLYYYELGRLFEIDIINKTIKQIIIGSIELQEIIRITDLEFNK